MHDTVATSQTYLKQLVLTGGGHSHLFVIAALAMKPIPGLHVVLISKDTMTGYSGMLPGYIAGHYDFEETHIDLRKLCTWAGVTFIDDSVVGLDTGTQQIKTARHGEIHYDWLSINIGSAPGSAQIAGHTERLIPVKPIPRFLEAIDRIDQRAEKGGAPLRIGVIGGGAAGIEVVVAVRQRLERQRKLRGDRGATFEYCVFNADTTILPTHNPRVRNYFQRYLGKKGVVVHDDFDVSKVETIDVVSASGERVPVDEIILATTASPQSWPGQAGLEVDEKGFIAVNRFLQSMSHPNVFAAGDIASIVSQPTEKAGVFAVRQGQPLAKNLRRMIEQKRLKPYRPQRKWLALLTRGDRYAVASRGRFFARGRWVWYWKNRIDRKFMRMFQVLPPMPEPEPPRYPAGLLEGNQTLIQHLGMRCAGCGAKVSGEVLQEVLDKIRQDLDCLAVEGVAQRDDAAVIQTPPGKVLLQSIDYFTAIVDDPWELGRIAANHALGDIYAMGGRPHSALALVSLPPVHDALLKETLRLMLQGAISVFRQAGVVLAGGHSSEAQQMALGFSVNGFAEPSALLHKGGLRPGDQLILTKPLGTGVLFAAQQQLKAKGQWIDQAIASMTQSSRDAADILLRHGATACTDVTGFGLLGHLVEMLCPKNRSVRIDLDAVPTLPGALEVSRAGVRSSLFHDNAKVRHLIENLDDIHTHPAFELMFDPQTAGGLLAAVPGDRSSACVAALRDIYSEATVVGEVIDNGMAGPSIVVESLSS